ncbi:hypothetical protein ERJ75_000324900 [Trypanosoma vivax]|uniref:BAR domain-containing protein n=1 Tax=Trypanosoma vivax (strain Y486) TaxID=1055687 RepID=F9WM61_TRYVY|nr:hypothetical protein ERJ75_000324900 [Trypanosoma vivax]CCD18612.1 hypothetical protein, conserved [Trypanosoma vivax Y486]|eukprot:CCD18612.1 hypothetical protein, conserved [Trypanosoma vivax Y486]
MGSGGSIPHPVDKEIEGNVAYLKKLAAEVKSFEGNLTSTFCACQTLLKSCEGVSRSFVGFAYDGEEALYTVVKDFDTEVRSLKEGAALETLQSEMSDSVKVALNPLKKQLEKALKVSNSLACSKKKFDKCAHSIDKAQQKCAKQNRSLTENKSYAKLSRDRDSAQTSCETKKQELSEEVNALRILVKEFIASGLPGYVSATAGFAKDVGTRLEVAAEHSRLQALRGPEHVPGYPTSE